MVSQKNKNGFYAQSGGVTAVINASAFGVLETARQHSENIKKYSRAKTEYSARYKKI